MENIFNDLENLAVEFPIALIGPNEELTVDSFTALLDLKKQENELSERKLIDYEDSVFYGE